MTDFGPRMLQSTMTSPQRWTYLNVPDERRRRLESFGDFDWLLEEVVNEAACNFVRWEDGSNEVPPEFFRPVFRVLLLRTGDALFNGPHGLRAAYFHDADEGAEANRRLLTALEEKLLAAVKPSGERGKDLTGAQLALRGNGSKIWSETNPYGVQPGWLKRPPLLRVAQGNRPTASSPEASAHLEPAGLQP